MNSIFMVVEDYYNGEYYEDAYYANTNCHAFATKEEAEEYIRQIDIKSVDADDETETVYADDRYFEVFEGDEIFKYAYHAPYAEYKRVFARKIDSYTSNPRYETKVYIVEEVPFGR